jgi:hypothetical protein
MKSDEQIVEELREATRGLMFMSESDYAFEVVRWDAEPTRDFLRALTEQDASAPVEEQSAPDFFRAPASEADWKGEAELATARKFQSLVRLLEENLTDLRVFRVGEINMPVYVVGRSSSGSWLGVSTRVVET